jgi:hypothetical protein
VRKYGLSAAAGLLVVLVVLAAGCGARASALSHTCSATDRAFINTAQLNMASLGLWADEYKSGDAKAQDVISEAHSAAQAIAASAPEDPSLQQTRALMNSMFNEYARAVWAHWKNKDASSHLVRAYGLADFAHDVLINAEPALKARGCDVSQLL